MNDDDNYVLMPLTILNNFVLNEGDTYVAYKNIGNFSIRDIQNLKELLNINDDSEMKFRSNIKLVDKIILKQHLKTEIFKYPRENKHLLGVEKNCSQNGYSVIKLPHELLDDDLLKFKCIDECEYLHFNIYKLRFNEDGSYEINDICGKGKEV